MELAGYTVTRGPEAELTLARTRTPFDWQVVPRAFAVASIALPLALSFVSEDNALLASFFGAMVTPYAFLMVANAYAESPTLIDIRHRLVIGDSDGKRIVRIDDRTWPAAAGVTVVVGERHHSPKHGPSYKSYSVLFALPDAIVEFHCGREMAANAQALAAMLRAALREPQQERVRVHSRRTHDGDAALAFLGIGAVLLALGAPIRASALGLSPQRLLVGLTGFWVWAVSWAAARAMRAAVKSAGPELLRAVKER